MNRVVVLNVVGLTRSLIGDHTPHLKSLLPGSLNLDTIIPALTAPVQSTYLTGKLPCEHGIVANGWYFRDLSEIWFWRQSNRLVQSDKIWHLARRRNPAFTCANSFWWYNMVTDADWSVTPRPVYCSDGRKLPDCYSVPSELRAKFNRELGLFPLFQFWGPATSIASSKWISKAAMSIEEMYQPTLSLVYLPHLDYCLQRLGPGDGIIGDLQAIDDLCRTLTEFFCDRGCRVVILSEYGINPVDKALHPNRILRKAGYLSVKEDLGREYLDPGTSLAFAVSDHQIAHVYIRDPKDEPAVKKIFEERQEVEQVLDEPAQREFGLNHPRSGELVLIGKSDAWFTYYFWEDDDRAPDYARTVDIHRKPGYDPCELFIDPKIRFPKLKIARTLLKKTLGFSSLMEITPLDPSLVKGSHGRTTDQADEGPIFMTTEPKFLQNSELRATDVLKLLLDHVFSD
jgi:predicted AlkP superfamily pyrophosphatase or phosphodiesterase